jgi:hypothetical protein
MLRIKIRIRTDNVTFCWIGLVSFRFWIRIRVGYLPVPLFDLDINSNKKKITQKGKNLKICGINQMVSL